VIGLPQRPQKVRVPFAELLKTVGSPWVQRKRSLSIVNQVTTGAPEARRHMLQWQWPTSPFGPPWTS
jgi:hypothetical protein